LLLLRATIGIAGVVQSARYVAAGGHPALGIWLVGLLEMVCGALLVIGFVTPISGTAIGAGYAAIALSWVHGANAAIFIDRLAALFGLVAALSIVLMGPGAVSLDARLFGRREIVIPRQADDSLRR
jgi:uncharacterized membrane protein YphA (DoxX/SURF4 family)